MRLSREEVAGEVFCLMFVAIGRFADILKVCGFWSEWHGRRAHPATMLRSSSVIRCQAAVMNPFFDSVRQQGSKLVVGKPSAPLGWAARPPFWTLP